MLALRQRSCRREVRKNALFNLLFLALRHFRSFAECMRNVCDIRASSHVDDYLILEPRPLMTVSTSIDSARSLSSV
jgi:hypothetical protein